MATNDKNHARPSSFIDWIFVSCFVAGLLALVVYSVHKTSASFPPLIAACAVGAACGAILLWGIVHQRLLLGLALYSVICLVAILIVPDSSFAPAQGEPEANLWRFLGLMGAWQIGWFPFLPSMFRTYEVYWRRKRVSPKPALP